MLLADLGALLIGGFLMCFIVAMVSVEEIANLANLVLEVNSLNLGVVELCLCAMSVRPIKLAG